MDFEFERYPTLDYIERHHIAINFDTIAEVPKRQNQEENRAVRELMEFVLEKLMAFQGKKYATHLATIFRLPDWFHETSKQLCMPRMVSIGPYHHGKNSFETMEKHKWSSLQIILDRDGVELEVYLREMRALEKRARQCYSEKLNLQSHEFVTMLLLDGCFILEWFSKHDAMCDIGWAQDIKSDMFLLENQIPFFVIKNLYMLSGGSDCQGNCNGDCSLLKLFDLKKIFDNTNKLSPPYILSCNNIDHLLHLYYTAMMQDVPQRTEKSNQVSGKRNPHLFPLSKLIAKSSNAASERRGVFFSNRRRSLSLPFHSERGDGDKPVTELSNLVSESDVDEPVAESSNAVLKRRDDCKIVWSNQGYNILCVSELHEAGVKFKEKREPRHLLDISFENGVMKIPFIKIEDLDRVILWNMVAFEQTRFTSKQTLSSYLALMDSLINTEKDVVILERSGILENYLQNDEDVAKFFNQFGKHFSLDYEKHYFHGLFQELKIYSSKRWPKYRARLHHDYFSNPWAGISVGAAVFLLLLNMGQTFLTIIQTFYDPKEGKFS